QAGAIEAEKAAPAPEIRAAKIKQSRGGEVGRARRRLGKTHRRDEAASIELGIRGVACDDAAFGDGYRAVARQEIKRVGAQVGHPIGISAEIGDEMGRARRLAKSQMPGAD